MYKRLIKPVLMYPNPYYEPSYKDIESPEVWYPEEKEQELRDKYKDMETGWEHIVFKEKYEKVD